ncbi:MAG: WbqC family protein [Methylococcaceae bacterium]|nr:WbqC family protein [Methylococcaceae bacterium]MDZ4158089.1 WbqC family protein [Methylococcales bacterium]MDP2392880.1 WbqC family protein [Methylococcaceae bacterium]MDP3020408.1 WbqC family protein [Methylococcaceae bacterium]MDP3390893.1 WbqC family protein [Methylococcaceae bacterium]
MTKTLTLSAHQPAYLPWLGYLDKIARVDVFVFLDNVQFEKNSFTNRNKIKTPQGPQWLTIPVKLKGHTNATLLDTLVDDTQGWRVKHLKSIEMNYRKAPYFKECFPMISGLLLLPESNLSELCWQHLQFWLAEFEIKTEVYRSSALPVSSKKSDLVLDLCKQIGANNYISGPFGKDYLNEQSFAVAGIKIDYQDFKHPVYPQLWGDFEPNMCILDYWMNCGSNSNNFLQRRNNGIQF